MLLMLRFNVIICIMNELDITNAFHTYFPIKAIYNVAPQHCLCTSRVGINVADVNKKIGIKLIKPPCNRYKRCVWIANSPREKVIAYPDDWYPVRKAYFSHIYFFEKRPVEIQGVLQYNKKKIHMWRKKWGWEILEKENF